MAKVSNARVIPWEGPRFFGAAYEIGSLSGGFAVGTKEQAEEIARQLLGKDEIDLAHYVDEADMHVERWRRKLLGLDEIARLTAKHLGSRND